MCTIYVDMIIHTDVYTQAHICHTAPPVVFGIATNAENNDIKITWKVRRSQ